MTEPYSHARQFPATTKFFVPGDPMGEPRARARAFVPKGGSRAVARVYRPRGEKQGPWREAIAEAAGRVHPPYGDAVLVGPVTVALDFFFNRPKDRKGERWRSSKPDVDNLEKLVLDVLTMAGRFWIDDAQVVAIRTRKLYFIPEGGLLDDRLPGLEYPNSPGVQVEIEGAYVARP